MNNLGASFASFSFLPNASLFPSTIQPRTLFLANGPSFGNFPANVQWVPQNGFFQPVIYNHPFETKQLPSTSSSSNLPVTTNLGGGGDQANLVQQQDYRQKKEWFGKFLLLFPQQKMRNLTSYYFLKKKDNMFALAHQKYNSQDFAGAHQILQELHRLDSAHLPTLLLLGCTCYSLKLFNLSIFYNNMILGIDPQFSEAYSNLGTTHRVIFPFILAFLS
jgi:hypothetical protein